LLQLLQPVVGVVPLQFLMTDCKQFEGFEDIIAEPLVELLFYLFNLFVALFRKGSGQVLSNYLPSIPYYIIYNGVKTI
jgi:hypothetical protein